MKFGQNRPGVDFATPTVSCQNCAFGADAGLFFPHIRICKVGEHSAPSLGIEEVTVSSKLRCDLWGKQKPAPVVEWTCRAEVPEPVALDLKYWENPGPPPRPRYSICNTTQKESEQCCKCGAPRTVPLVFHS